jgi:acyl carrier protein
VAAVVRRAAHQLDRDKPFRALGLDSLMGLEMRNRIESAFSIGIAATLIWNFPNIASLASELARRADIPLDADAPAVGAAVTLATEDDDAVAKLLREIETMSDEEALRAGAEGAGPGTAV